MTTHVYRDLDIPGEHYVNCETGQVYTYDKVSQIKDVLRHRTFESYLDYITLPTTEYKTKYYGTPFEF